MNKAAPDETHINYCEIQFPSDSLTIKTLRRLSPENFDSEPLQCGNLLRDQVGKPNPWVDVVNLIQAERVVAEAAFFKAARVECSEGYMEDARGYRDDVVRLYSYFGIAS